MTSSIQPKRLCSSRSSSGAVSPCGLFFQVQGPRRVKVYAVWTGDENRILFYDSAGVRFAETRLMDGPHPRKLAA